MVIAIAHYAILKDHLSYKLRGREHVIGKVRRQLIYKRCFWARKWLGNVPDVLTWYSPGVNKREFVKGLPEFLFNPSNVWSPIKCNHFSKALTLKFSKNRSNSQVKLSSVHSFWSVQSLQGQIRIFSGSLKVVNIF